MSGGRSKWLSVDVIVSVRIALFWSMQISVILLEHITALMVTSAPIVSDAARCLVERPDV